MNQIVDECFKQTLSQILENGCKDENPRPKYEDGTSAYTLFITDHFEKYDTENGVVPISSLRRIPIKMGLQEIAVIYQDQDSSLAAFEARGINWWSHWGMPDNTIGNRYGATVKKYDLMNKLLHGLETNPFGRRHILNLWQEEDLLTPAKLDPCAFMTEWAVRVKDNEFYLDCSLSQRSSDYLVAGHINMIQYHGLQHMIAKHLGYKVGSFSRHTMNLHIYDRHIEQAKEILQRKSPDVSNLKFYLDVPDKTNFYDIDVNSFVLEGYEPIAPQLKFELAI